MKATVACPNRSDTIFGWTPASNASVAKVCRRSWNRISGRPCSCISDLNVLEVASGWSGDPSGLEKTRPGLPWVK